MALERVDEAHEPRHDEAPEVCALGEVLWVEELHLVREEVRAPLLNLLLLVRTRFRRRSVGNSGGRGTKRTRLVPVETCLRRCLLRRLRNGRLHRQSEQRRASGPATG